MNYEEFQRTVASMQCWPYRMETVVPMARAGMALHVMLESRDPDGNPSTFYMRRLFDRAFIAQATDDRIIREIVNTVEELARQHVRVHFRREGERMFPEAEINAP